MAQPTTLTDELVAFIADLEIFPKPLGQAWWNSPQYALLMVRKRDLLERVEAIEAGRTDA